MPKIYPLLIALTFFITHAAYSMASPDTVAIKPAQTDTLKKSSIKFGITYLSNNVFMGRAGLTVTPTFAPEVKYTLKSGMYFSGSLDFLPDSKGKKFDGGDIAAGYDFDLSDDLSGGVSFAKLFSASNSTRIGSSISSIFNGSLDYDIGSIVTTSISAAYYINKQGVTNDGSINFGLSHDFIALKVFADKDLFLISPTVSANMGTQNFYDAYLTKKVFKNATRTAAQNTLIAKFEQNVNQFKLLDYELSLPMEYKAGHFIFQFTPTYAIVENAFQPATAKFLGVADNATIFYFTTGISLKF